MKTRLRILAWAMGGMLAVVLVAEEPRTLPAGTKGADQSRQPPPATPGAGVEAAAVHGFTSMDRDRNGRITLNEFVMSSQSGLKGGQDDASGSPRPTRPRGDVADGMATAPSGEAGAGSGAVNERERASRTGENAIAGGRPRTGSAAEKAAELFRQIDTDGDGELTREELETYQRRAGGAPGN